MAVPGDPPNGTPDGTGGGDDEFRPDEFRSDEYRSVVFDEDFVRAARLQEYSAQERMGEHARAVRSRSIWSSGSAPGTSTPGRGARQGMLLVLLIATAFAVAVYLGLRNPYVPPPGGPAQALTSTVVPLAPAAAVPGGLPPELFAKSPAADYRVGAAGITLPAVRRTHHFTDVQVVTALSIAKDYLVQSSLDPDVLAGSATRPVRVLLDPDQLAQFDRSMTSPSGDGRHAVTGWLVRFDPATAVMADSRVRVSGTLAFEEVAQDVLEVTTDHTFVYAVRPATGAPSAADGASLFTVRRELRMRFDRDDLSARRLELASAYVMAGPQDCSADPAGGFRPLLAGAGPTTVGPAASDPYASGQPRRSAGLCGVLAAPATPGAPVSPAP
ncbi:SCO2583 family membrane protein [Streptomyces yangpuensis]|uniref:SCO2583 family membrane protein n=1 Tax=Streptomyces yangpuensis TaxID=1648182 RepID=UPI0035D9ED0C